MRARPLLASAAAGALLLGLAGCASGPGSEAVNVYGTSYSVEQVEQIGDALGRAGGAPQGGRQEDAAVVAMIVQSELARAAVAAADDTITPAEREEAINEVAGVEDLRNDPELRELLAMYGDIQYAQDKLTPEEIAAQAPRANIRINPRYGNWDYQQSRLQTDARSLSFPLPQR